MCDVCCKEFRGWCGAFTKTERALVLLEVLLLVVLLVLLVFLILHLLVCTHKTSDEYHEQNKTNPDHRDTNQTSTVVTTVLPTDATKQTPETSTENYYQTDLGSKCSWTPSSKTTAATHYYLEDTPQDDVTTIKKNTNNSTTPNVTDDKTSVMANNDSSTINSKLDKDFNQSDGEEDAGSLKKHIVALVKMKPPNDVTFGCILTIVSEYWTVTAASCIEAIEEVDSLDSFVIMEGYGTKEAGELQPVQDVRIHPMYQGTNRSHDLAGLRSEGSLLRPGAAPLPLASPLDYALLSIGERLVLLGYGPLRGVDKSPSGSSLRRVGAHLLRGRQCTGGEAGPLRHLWAGRAAGAGAAAAASGAAPLCAGVLRARRLPCNYCAGAPLLRARAAPALLAVLSDDAACGATCEPQLYVNVAALADWIRALFAE